MGYKGKFIVAKEKVEEKARRKEEKLTDAEKEAKKDKSSR